MYRITERPNDWVIEKENVLGLWEFVATAQAVTIAAHIVNDLKVKDIRARRAA